MNPGRFISREELEAQHQAMMARPPALHWTEQVPTTPAEVQAAMDALDGADTASMASGTDAFHRRMHRLAAVASELARGGSNTRTVAQIMEG